MTRWYHRWCMPALSYAEMHYAPAPRLSLLYRPWPEILADAPHRVEPGCAIPLLLLIKDADQFPLTLQRVRVSLCYPDGLIRTHIHDFHHIAIDQRCWQHMVQVQPDEDFSGVLRIAVEFDVSGAFGVRTFRQHSYKGGSRVPLEVLVAAEPMPRLSGWMAGDLHTHSIYTDDPVEFGAPLPAMQQAARAIGMDCCAVTDHSYDLTGRPREGRSLQDRWEQFRAEVAGLNRNSGPLLVPGEEVSCGNSRGRNIHLLVLNHPDCLPGDGDGAKGFGQTRPDLSLTEVAAQIGEDTALLAAHPEVRPPISQQVILRRGKWETADYGHPRLDGLEILNGALTRDFFDGIARYRSLLLDGRRLALAAGTDAHGNFNRFRQVGVPLVRLREGLHQRFGWARTLVRTGDDRSIAGIIRALRAGETIITTGPVVDLSLSHSDGHTAGPGGSIAGAPLTISLHALSTQEFGKIRRIRLLVGDLEQRREMVYKDLRNPEPYDLCLQLPAPLVRAGYVRAECETKTRHRCLTSPVWFAHTADAQITPQ